MKLSEYIKTWEGVQLENKFSRLIILALVAANIALGIKVLYTYPIVTMQPPTLESEAWVARDQASRSYKEAWGLYLATQLGNVTPGTVELVKQWLGPVLSPNVYDEVISALEVQAIQIKTDRVSMRFEPRIVSYEPKSEKVFVYGFSYTIGVNGNENRTDRTYEFAINISKYLPTIEYIETYADKPRTEKVLRLVERREQARISREKENAN